MEAASRIMNRRMISVKSSSGQLRWISSWMWVKGTMCSSIRPAYRATCSRRETTFISARSLV